MKYTLCLSRRFLWPVGLLLLLGLSACSPSLAKKDYNSLKSGPPVSILDQVLEKGIIRIGTTGDYMPYSYHISPDTSEYLGIDIALAKNLGKALGVEVRFVRTSWPSLMQDLKDRKFDMAMCGITITLDRQKVALFSVPFASGGKAAITRDEHVQKYRSLEAINQAGVRVIVNPGGTNEAFARKHFPQSQLILNEDNLTIFQKLVDQEADVMVTDAIETRVQAIIHPELEAVNPDQPFNFFEKAYLLPVDLRFKAYIDQWVNLRLKDGTYQRIVNAELESIKQHANRP